MIWAQSGYKTLRFSFGDVKMGSTRAGGVWRVHIDATHYDLVTKPYCPCVSQIVTNMVHAHAYTWGPILLYQLQYYAVYTYFD